MELGIGLKCKEGMPVVNSDDRFKHLLCLGSSGMGKTTFLSYLIRNEHKDNACIVLDPNGNLIENILPFLPKERIIYIDKHNPISLNPLSRDYLNWAENARELIQLINAAVKEVSPKQVEITALMTRLTKNALRVFKPNEQTIEHLMNFLDNDKLRKQIANDKFWTNFDKSNWEARESCKRITARLSLYYDDLALRPFLDGHNQFDLDYITENKKIVLINCEGLDDEATAFLGCLITNQVKSFYLHLAKVGGNPLFFYCDEFHLFIQEHFGRFLAEGRKYNFSFNFAGHSFALLDDFFKAMILRCYVKVILQNDGDDADILSRSLQIKSNDIINLKPFKAFARIGTKNHSIMLHKPPQLSTPQINTDKNVNEMSDKTHSESENKDLIPEIPHYNFLTGKWIYA
jgi:hypothetical protein